MVPKTASFLYKAVALSKLTYGLEVVDIPDESIAKMEDFQAKVPKSYQGLPDQASNIGAVHTIGWMSIRSHIDLIRLMFIWRLLLLPSQCIYKKVLVRRYVQHIYGGIEKHIGPLWRILQIATSYGLVGYIQTAVETGEYCDMKQWKILVIDRIKKNDEKKWQLQSKLFSSLEYVRNSMPGHNIASWWLYVQTDPLSISKCRHIFKLLFKVHRLNSCLYKYKDNDITSPLCSLCDMYESESADHMLFRCSRLQGKRDILWNDVLWHCPTQALLDYISKSRHQELCVFLLTCLHNTFVVEWSEFYRAICMFVSGMYEYRMSIN